MLQPNLKWAGRSSIPTKSQLESTIALSQVYPTITKTSKQGPLTPIRGRIKKGKTVYTNNAWMMTGTIAWSIKEDQDQVHIIHLPGSYYVPGSTSRILSPKHWSQQAQDNWPQPQSTWCAIYDDEITLYWNQQKYKRSIWLNPGQTNAATIRSAPGYSRFTAFSSNLGVNWMMQFSPMKLFWLVSNDEQYPTNHPTFGVQQTRASDQRESTIIMTKFHQF